MKNLLIRPASLDDVHTLQTIGIRTFSEAFAEKNTEADMAMYLMKAFSTKRIERELQDPEVQYHLAVNDQHLIGYMKINTGSVQSESFGPGHLEIERIYVLAEAQGHGVGQILLEEALRIAQNAGIGTIWLGVWEHNLPAIRFYERNAFFAFGKHDFMLGEDRQTDILMRRTIDIKIET